MLYFKDAPIPPSRIDPVQLSKVKEFRDSLGDVGALYCDFTGVEQFEKLIRVHLARQVQAWKKQLHEWESSAVRIESTEQPTQKSEAESEGEFGILDLFEIFEDRFAELEQISERIGGAIEELGDKMAESATDLSQLPRNSRGNVDRKTAKRFISRAAADMNKFTARIEVELPLFNDTFNTGMNGIIRSLSMSTGLYPDESVAEQSMEALEAVFTLRGILATTKMSINEFRQKIVDFPPMTGELNRAKRGLVSVLDRLVDEFNNGQTLLREAEAVVRDCSGDEDA